MKNVIIFILFCISGITVIAQPTINYRRNALAAGSDNQMIYTDYADPGLSGADILWDFSSLSFRQEFTGFVKNSSESIYNSTFSSANIELTEFGSHFFFNVSESQIEEYGYSSVDGYIQTQYFTPSVKLKFPFTYGQIFSGVFSGNTIVNSVISGEITGDYMVEADAYGTLILPGNHYFDNTLRIKSEKRYSCDYGNSHQEVEIVTHRWYDQFHRYPLLVLTSYSISADNTTKTYHQAAINNNSVSFKPFFEESVTLFPNPASTELMLKIDVISTGILTGDIYSLTGAKLRTFQREIDFEGHVQLDISKEIEGLEPANYLLVIKTMNGIFQKEIVIVN